MENTHYTVKPFTSADAEKVPPLFWEVYGDAYPMKMVYDPEQLIAAFESRQYFPFVVRTSSNRLIGYGSLYQSAPFKGIFEFGQGAVSPEYRKAGLGRLLFEYVEQYIQTLPGAQVYFGEAVCNHTHTQKAGVHIHTIETAIEVDLMPGQVYENYQGLSGRVAVLFARERGQGAGYREVALVESAEIFARPLQYGLTAPGGILGGGLPHYNLYETRQGWIAVAVLEQHFWHHLNDELGIGQSARSYKELQEIFLTKTASE